MRTFVDQRKKHTQQRPDNYTTLEHPVNALISDIGPLLLLLFAYVKTTVTWKLAKRIKSHSSSNTLIAYRRQHSWLPSKREISKDAKLSYLGKKLDLILTDADVHISRIDLVHRDM